MRSLLQSEIQKKKAEADIISYSQCGSINRNQLCYIVIEQKKNIQFIELCVQLKSQHTNSMKELSLSHIF